MSVAILIGVACSLAVLGAGAIWLSGDRSQLSVTPPDSDLGIVPLGERELMFRVSNRGDQPRRIVGMNQACANGCCYRAANPDQVDVPPGETVEYRCVLAVKEVGPFDGEIVLFLDEDGFRTFSLPIHGVGVPPAGGTDVPKANP
jgi:hypothetical protein